MIHLPILPKFARPKKRGLIAEDPPPEMTEPGNEPEVTAQDIFKKARKKGKRTR